jgi:hypothetical protein
MIVRGFLVPDKEGSSVAYSVVRKLGPDAVSRQKDRTGAVNVFVRGYSYLFSAAEYDFDFIGDDSKERGGHPSSQP